jgi:hypothetical protein
MHCLDFIAQLKVWQFMLGLYVILSVSMGLTALCKRPRSVWLEQHPEDRKPNER